MFPRVSLVAIATAALLVLGCGPEPKTKRADWPDLGVGVDKVGLTKTLIAECCFRGYVRSIQLGNFDGDAEVEIAVVPQTGVYLFDVATLKQKAKFEYQKPDGDTLWFGLSPFLVPGKKDFTIAMLGGGYGDVGLLDRAGKELWKFKPNAALSPNGMVVGDSVMGRPRFYVCDRGMIYKLDADGKVIWKIAEDASYIALVRDERGNEAGFATADSRSRTLNVWSSAGKREQQIELPLPPDGLEYVRAGDTSGFVIKSGLKIAFVDRAGKHRFTYSYGGLPVYHGPSAVLVRFTPQQPPLLAVRSTSRSATGKSVLSLLSLDGTHLYQEYLDGGPALGVVPVKNENRDRLLVGEGTTKLWAYEKTSPNSSIQSGPAQASGADFKR